MPSARGPGASDAQATDPSGSWFGPGGVGGWGGRSGGVVLFVWGGEVGFSNLPYFVGLLGTTIPRRALQMSDPINVTAKGKHQVPEE